MSNNRLPGSRGLPLRELNCSAPSSLSLCAKNGSRRDDRWRKIDTTWDRGPSKRARYISSADNRPHKSARRQNCDLRARERERRALRNANTINSRVRSTRESRDSSRVKSERKREEGGGKGEKKSERLSREDDEFFARSADNWNDTLGLKEVLGGAKGGRGGLI